MHQGDIDHEKNARGDVPVNKIPGPGHEVFAEVKWGPKETDKGQKTNGSLRAAVVMNELKVEWYVVNGNEDRRACASHDDVE